MNSPHLQPHLILGLRTDLRANAQFITDEDIIYPVGTVLCVHNHDKRQQKYIRLADKGRNVTDFVVSPDKKLVAVAERGDKPIITLWCPVTDKKKRQILLPQDKEINTDCYTAIAFTSDSRNVLGVSGYPDWTLYQFKCDKGQLLSTGKANNTGNTGYVRQIACNPDDPNAIALIGNNIIRFMSCVNYTWRPYGFNKAEDCDFTTAAWLNQHRLIVGTADGRIFILEHGDLKFVFWAKDLTVIDFKPSDDLHEISRTSLEILKSPSLDPAEDNTVRSLTVIPRGFAFGYTLSTVHLFEMETTNKYTKRSIFRIPNEPETKPATINSITISPSQSILLVTCNKHQLYGATLWMQDPTVVEVTDAWLTEFGGKLHEGGIASMAVCAWKPLLLTAGEDDRTLMLWNYENEEIELIQKFEDDLYGLDLHPTGLFAIVGFSDKLRFITIMIDEFDTTREFSVKVCKSCAFSTMGHLFAAANGNFIQVYSSISFEMVYILKGHSGCVTGLSWTKDDTKIASCGNDGAVYEWMVTESKRKHEVIMKECKFTGVQISSDDKLIYVISQNGNLQEVKRTNQKVLVTPHGLDSMVLSRIDEMLMVSGNDGNIYNIKMPLLDISHYQEYCIHSSVVTTMLVSHDDKYLFTGSSNGTLCFWKLLNADDKAIKLNKDFAPSKNILISREVLEKKITQIKNLQARFGELEVEFAYQLRQNDTVNELRMHGIHAEYCEAIEQLKEKIDTAERDHVEEIRTIDDQIKEMKSEHEEAMRSMDALYHQKLVAEYEKFLRLEEKMERMRRNYMKELDDLSRAKKASEEEIRNALTEKLEDKDIQYEELLEEKTQQVRAHEIIKQQIEEDADREIYYERAHHAKELRQEQDLATRIRAEAVAFQRKLIACQKNVDELMSRLSRTEHEHLKVKKCLIKMEKDNVDLQKKIEERDATICSKEMHIASMKRKHQMLEKYKFVLGHKIKVLRSEIEPRQRMIDEQALQIHTIVKEVEGLQRLLFIMDVESKELRKKLYASAVEMANVVARNRALANVVKKIKVDIVEASRCVQNVPMLIKMVTKMYHKYNIDERLIIEHRENMEVDNEFMRQRKFLEGTVEVMKTTVSKSNALANRATSKLARENITLLKEINMLRKALVHTRNGSDLSVE